MRIMDRDRDGKISAKEFESKGVSALPNFDDIGAEGHHYDVESGEKIEDCLSFLISCTHSQNFSCITKVRRSTRCMTYNV